MKSIMRQRFEFTEEELCAIAYAMGGEGQATRDVARLWLTTLVESTLEKLVFEYEDVKLPRDV